jgi:hypothetical protein
MPTKKKRATSQTGRYRFQYAAKFICTSNIPGTSQTSGSFLPGNYQTVVNVHNPNERTVKLRAKMAFGGEGLISKFLHESLGPDDVTRYVCADIREKFGMNLIHGAEGFLVIESTHSLDVIAVYTAGPLGEGVASIDVENVKERPLPIR